MGWQIQLDQGQFKRTDYCAPEPGLGQVKIAIEAVSLNARDLGIRAGVYPAATPLTPLSDGAGTVIGVGPDVTDLAIGDKVQSHFYPYWMGGAADAANHAVSLGCEVNGMLRSEATLPACAVMPYPKHLSPTEAATLPCAGVTAWAALFSRGQLKPGEHVLIQGTGGVAIYALQLAKAAGAQVTIISSDDAKLERARALGADLTLNYVAEPDWGEALNAHYGGPSIDLVLELGGEKTLRQSLACLKTGGRISLIGLLSGPNANFSIIDVLMKQLQLTGITVGTHQDAQALNRFMALHRIKPVIHHTYGDTDVERMYSDMAEARHFGKLVMEITA